MLSGGRPLGGSRCTCLGGSRCTCLGGHRQLCCRPRARWRRVLPAHCVRPHPIAVLRLTRYRHPTQFDGPESAASLEGRRARRRAPNEVSPRRAYHGSPEILKARHGGRARSLAQSAWRAFGGSLLHSNLLLRLRWRRFRWRRLCRRIICRLRLRCRRICWRRIC